MRQNAVLCGNGLTLYSIDTHFDTSAFDTLDGF